MKSETNPVVTVPDHPVERPVRRTFILGDEWLYYKFYCGPKTADMLLTELVKPLTEEMLGRQWIDHWFFIRYSDPGLHIRVRFHVPDLRNLGPVLEGVRGACRPYLDEGLVWKVQADTYQREIERYGANTMELGEKLFYYDSRMLVDMLAMIEGDEGERIRWLFGLRAVDALLGDFGFDMEGRYQWVTRLRESFGQEHNWNRGLKEQMEKKFRTNRGDINDILNRAKDQESELQPLFELLAQKSAGVAPIVEEIRTIEKNGKLAMPLPDLLGSYSHMLINRLFKSKQRTHELVLYDFLHRYYKSALARLKYDKGKQAKNNSKK